MAAEKQQKNLHKEVQYKDELYLLHGKETKGQPLSTRIELPT